ncbi:DUF5011 domain-containing protein [Hyalangium minutum]|uniref:Pesticidal crystal protein Cry22Aa Ig-like domain-containing protein n=1 Tax=Hyalangium minutum TaxID=394096 RepID=A0A085WXV1_9BACT|nr:DUF5011 domain-containing protein [Hyalangium minutum]KFE72514.1 hypothetical protein DB31_0777 [Hyalangium minutum]
MTIVDFRTAPAHRRIVSPRWLILCAVLAACSPATPEAPSEAPPVSQTQPLTGTPELSPEFAVNPAASNPTHQEGAVVAAGNGLYLVVWMDTSDTHSPDIYGVRIRASDGERLDTSPLLIGTGSTTQYQPAVAFDGVNFLVVWTDIRSVPAIYGARVRASDGVVLDTSPFLISRTPMGPYQLPQFSPAVAFDGTYYLVTWHGNYYENGPVSTGVQSIRVRTDGTFIDASSALLARDGSNSRVAYVDGIYLVAWQKNQNVEAMRIRANSMTRLDTTPISLAATSGNENSPAVAGQNGEFLAVWIGADNALWGRRLNAETGAKLGSADFSVGPAALAPPEVTFDGENYRVLWQATREGARKVLTTRVARDGTVAADTELLLADPSSAQALRGGIAAAGSNLYLAAYTAYDTALSKSRGRFRLVTEGPSNVSPELAVSLAPTGTQHLETAAAAGNDLYLVVWSEVNSTSGNRPDILGVRVRATDGALLDATPLRIGTSVPSADLSPAVAFDGTNFLVVWEGIDAVPLIFGARVRASDGAVLDATPLLISRPAVGASVGLPQLHPAVAFDGTNYVVAWQGLWYTSDSVDSGVQAIRVRPDGTFLDTNATIVGPGGSDARVASTNGISLVAWTQNTDVQAARLNGATGQLLDASPLSVAATSAWEVNPAVAAHNGEFLVAWTSGADLRARLLRASDGALLGTSDFLVGPSVQAPADATFDGQDYRISWQATRSGGRTLVSTRVSAQGVVDADAELSLSRVHTSAGTYRGNIAAVSPGQLLVSYSQFDAMVQKTRARARRVSDPRLGSVPQMPETCSEAGAPILVLTASSPLTLECGSGPYIEPGARAVDACGNAIEVHAYNTGADSSGPGPNLRYEGTYSVSYAAWDALGQTVTATREVIVDDRRPPTLTLLGDAHMTHTCGSQWQEPGWRATDECYANVSAQVQRTGEVNGWAAGTYTVTYSLTDAGGNSATPITRTVDVVNCPW